MLPVLLDCKCIQSTHQIRPGNLSFRRNTGKNQINVSELVNDRRLLMKNTGKIQLNVSELVNDRRLLIKNTGKIQFNV
jgi:hypothetical protein